MKPCLCGQAKDFAENTEISGNLPETDRPDYPILGTRGSSGEDLR
ncbi:hypothetical protein CSE45_4999 [Citreicella sp. SE45]|nr:hypothetical protein CSE45_4999 [Citreicella sp. SE45]